MTRAVAGETANKLLKLEKWEQSPLLDSLKANNNDASISARSSIEQGPFRKGESKAHPDDLQEASNLDNALENDKKQIINAINRIDIHINLRNSAITRIQTKIKEIEDNPKSKSDSKLRQEADTLGNQIKILEKERTEFQSAKTDLEHAKQKLQNVKNPLIAKPIIDTLNDNLLKQKIILAPSDQTVQQQRQLTTDRTKTKTVARGIKTGAVGTYNAAKSAVKGAPRALDELISLPFAVTRKVLSSPASLYNAVVHGREIQDFALKTDWKGAKASNIPDTIKTAHIKSSHNAKYDPITSQQGELNSQGMQTLQALVNNHEAAQAKIKNKQPLDDNDKKSLMSDAEYKALKDASLDFDDVNIKLKALADIEAMMVNPSTADHFAKQHKKAREELNEALEQLDKVATNNVVTLQQLSTQYNNLKELWQQVSILDENNRHTLSGSQYTDEKFGLSNVAFCEANELLGKVFDQKSKIKWGYWEVQQGEGKGWLPKWKEEKPATFTDANGKEHELKPTISQLKRLEAELKAENPHIADKIKLTVRADGSWSFKFGPKPNQMGQGGISRSSVKDRLSKMAKADYDTKLAKSQTQSQTVGVGHKQSAASAPQNQSSPSAGQQTTLLNPAQAIHNVPQPANGRIQQLQTNVAETEALLQSKKTELSNHRDNKNNLLSLYKDGDPQLKKTAEERHAEMETKLLSEVTQLEKDLTQRLFLVQAECAKETTLPGPRPAEDAAPAATTK